MNGTTSLNDAARSPLATIRRQAQPRFFPFDLAGVDVGLNVDPVLPWPSRRLGVVSGAPMTPAGGGALPRMHVYPNVVT